MYVPLLSSKHIVPENIVLQSPMSKIKGEIKKVEWKERDEQIDSIFFKSSVLLNILLNKRLNINTNRFN